MSDQELIKAIKINPSTSESRAVILSKISDKNFAWNITPGTTTYLHVACQFADLTVLTSIIAQLESCHLLKLNLKTEDENKEIPLNKAIKSVRKNVEEKAAVIKFILNNITEYDASFFLPLKMDNKSFSTWVRDNKEIAVLRAILECDTIAPGRKFEFSAMLQTINKKTVSQVSSRNKNENVLVENPAILRKTSVWETIYNIFSPRKYLTNLSIQEEGPHFSDGFFSKKS